MRKQLALSKGIREAFRKEEIFEIGLGICREACQAKLVVRLARWWYSKKGAFQADRSPSTKA